jgi:hypothetical protein
MSHQQGQPYLQPSGAQRLRQHEHIGGRESAFDMAVA